MDFGWEKTVMKNSIRTLGRLVLAASLAMSHAEAFGEGQHRDDLRPPDLEKIAANPRDPSDTTLSPQARELIDKKIRDRRNLPYAIQRILPRKVRSYFRIANADGAPLNEMEIDDLVRDAAQVNEYFEQDNPSNELKQVPEKQIRPFLRSLTLGKLRAHLRNGKVTESVGEWTVESLVVRMQLKSVARFPDRVKRALELVSGPHLKGASKAAVTLVLGGSALYIFSDFGGSWIALTVYATVIGAFRAGPLATLMNALSAWFINPTAEFLKVIANRYTAPLETRINYFYDKRKPKSENQEEDAKENTVAKIANLEDDGTNIANMSEEEQRENWSKLLRVWVGTCKHYWKLLRDTQHLGRQLFAASMTAEQTASLYIETMDGRLSGLMIEEGQLLTPYLTGLLVRGDMDGKDRLDRLLDEYREMCTRAWMAELDEPARAQLGFEIRETEARFKEFGLSQLVIDKLWDVQVRRAHVSSALITGLATNEINLLSSPESNRNLLEEARVTQRAVHRGYNVQRFVEIYGPQIREMHRRMGFVNKDKDSGPRCETLLEKTVRGIPATAHSPQ
jgi:hypothetical protein